MRIALAIVVVVVSLLGLPFPHPGRPGGVGPAEAGRKDDICHHPKGHHGEERADLRVVGLRADGHQLGGGDRLRLNRLDELLVFVRWRSKKLVGHTQRVQLFSPDGALYQQFVGAIDADRESQTRVPVAGTWITEFDLVGKWCVAAFLDDDPYPSGREEFTLVAPSPSQP
jgi:hypothetical protein